MQQGITIDLSGDMEITDTTITEEDGSGVDRGDFIDEIGSDVPFTSKVGILGITEGFEKPDAIAIEAKDVTITGGGVYSVNNIDDSNVLETSKSSDIDINTVFLDMDRGELRHRLAYNGKIHTKTIKTTRSTNNIKTGRFPFEEIGGIELYLNGERVFEFKDFVFVYNSRGILTGADFYNRLSKGDEVNIVSIPVLKFEESDLSINVNEGINMVNLSLMESDKINLNSLNLRLDESRINAKIFAKFGVAELISIEGGSVVKSNYEENGYLNFSSGYLTISESKLEAGKSMKIKTFNKSAFTDKSTLSVGWESAEVRLDDRPKAYWDAKTGDIFNEFDQLYPLSFNNASSALNYLSFAHNVPTSAINLIQIYRPYNIRNIPQIDISSDQVLVENTMVESMALGNPSALKITSKKDIHISGQTNINKFSLMEFNSESVKIDSGFEFNSSFNSNIPIEILNIKSRGSVDLNGITLGSSLLVDSESSITFKDSTIDGNIVRLDAKDNLSLDQGELGITPFLKAQRVSLLGGDIDVGSVGVEAAVDVLVDGSRKIEIDGPTRINANLRGSAIINN